MALLAIAASQIGLRRSEIRTDNWFQLELADVGTISVNTKEQ